MKIQKSSCHTVVTAGIYFSSMASVKTVDESFLSLPKEELAMAKRLRALVREWLPKTIEEPNFGLGIPYYRHHRQICFIWPSSLYWSPNKKSLSGTAGTVTLGFCYGNLMSNDDGALHADGRKQVYCMYFKSLSEINEEQVRALLFEAELVDESFKKKKTKMFK